jgi:FAD synthase
MNGYGRGSKKLGVPTANLPHFDKELKESALSNGVYFGWGYLPNEREVLGCVVNIGRSPTFVDQVAAA